MIQKEDLARIREDRGPNDLELQIDILKNRKNTCRNNVVEQVKQYLIKNLSLMH
jgi:hypothetical protein